MKKLIVLTIFILMSSCSQKMNNVESIEIEQQIPKVKLRLTVNLFERIELDELASIAQMIYNRYDGNEYENVFITYMLPNMEYGNGCYAVSHYRPELELKIYELTKNEIENIENNFTISSRYWIDRKLLFEIREEKGKYYMKQYGDDLSTAKKYLLRKVQDSDTIFWDPENEFGDYYLLNSDNELSVHDEREYIKTYSSY